MGSNLHHAVIVTTYQQPRAEEIQRHARMLGLSVSAPIMSPINGFWTVCIGPHGSKDEWPDAVAGDAARGGFIAWLRRQDLVHSWAEVAYGDDSDAAREGLRRHSNDNNGPVEE